MSEQTVTSDTEVMSAFLREYGQAPADDPEVLEARTPDALKAEPKEDEDEPLDEATLKALGLDGGEEAPKGGEIEDAKKPSVDLEALAKALGLDASDLSLSGDGVRFKAKVDGQVLEVSPEELRKGYQLQSHFTRQQEEFLRQRREWEQAVQQQQSALMQQAQLAQQVLGHEEEALKARFTRSDWDTLRKEDPAEYAALVAEYNQELQKIRGRQQQVVQTLQERQQRQFQEHQQRLAQHMQEQGRLLVDKLGWKPGEIQEKGTRLNRYLREQGFTDQDIQGVVDHRAFLVVEKARQFDELQARIAKAREALQKAPKMPAGGTVSSPETVGARGKVKTSMTRLRESGSIDDAAAVFRNLNVV